MILNIKFNADKSKCLQLSDCVWNTSVNFMLGAVLRKRNKIYWS